MTPSSPPVRYRGDGLAPDGTAPASRGEAGRYIPDPHLIAAINTALIVEQPLLVTGEPGTGKTALAWSVATELGLGSVLAFHTRSDHQARDALYEMDHLMRFYHAQINDDRASKPELYVRWNALGEAIRSTERRLVLIDEIDKAPRDFPNDLLNEIDQMEFRVPELSERFQAAHRPVVIITSNSERQLPDPFLRRCVFHRIEFPSADLLQAILSERLGHLGLSDRLAAMAVKRFEDVRNLPGLEKKPATGELLAWVKVLSATKIDVGALEDSALNELPSHGALLKTEQDVRLLRSAG